ncbi:8596_t:CDS:1 [Scutellospora calospora]|uniref:8596_t:CDS:1 n=1 Tax=Scutellospora calospora TaxID=85575 RepID=A0ACA9JU13_9GLOM|nr:8596_t:CDS:1 [Scutellospora calospora]
MTKANKTSSRRATVPSEIVDRRPLTAFNRSSTFPYSRSQSARNKTKNTSNNNHHCSLCVKGDDDVNCLSARINRLEELIQNLNITVTSTPKVKNQPNPSNLAPSTNSLPFGPNAIDFSKMETNELVSFSTQLGTILFGNRNANNNKSNVMSINNILAH